MCISIIINTEYKEGVDRKYTLLWYFQYFPQRELWIASINSFSNSNDQVDALMLLAIPSLTQFSEMIPIFLLLLLIPFFALFNLFFNFQILILTYLGTYVAIVCR